ncbi:MAG: hypothetical protein IPP35_03990 [Elusimicrobia bacterium]|nr:hypothetical protein [Elusimicrobiota bacterium]
MARRFDQRERKEGRNVLWLHRMMTPTEALLNVANFLKAGPQKGDSPRREIVRHRLAEDLVVLSLHPQATRIRIERKLRKIFGTSFDSFPGKTFNVLNEGFRYFEARHIKGMSMAEVVAKFFGKYEAKKFRKARWEGTPSAAGQRVRYAIKKAKEFIKKERYRSLIPPISYDWRILSPKALPLLP